jgi:His/Glu/Gln/Arg/opine family amino acid ABC transporter permease subunit
VPTGLHNFLHTFFDPHQIAAVLPSLLRDGLLNTLEISALAILLGTTIGMLLATLLISRRWYVRAPARVYVDIFRGLPIIVTVMMVGLGLPIAGLRIFGRNSYPYAILALALVSGAYMSEIFRSGIQSVDRGQMEAARSLGLSYLRSMQLVVVPQGVRRVLPALTNQFVAMVKDSSLVYLLGLLASQRELFSIAKDTSFETGSLSALTAAGIVYLAITIPLTHAVNRLDRRMREGGAVRLATAASATNPSLQLIGTQEGR